MISAFLFLCGVSHLQFLLEGGVFETQMPSTLLAELSIHLGRLPERAEILNAVVKDSLGLELSKTREGSPDQIRSFCVQCNFGPGRLISAMHPSKQTGRGRFHPASNAISNVTKNPKGSHFKSAAISGRLCAFSMNPAVPGWKTAKFERTVLSVTRVIYPFPKDLHPMISQREKGVFASGVSGPKKFGRA
jgi:hypothetical protein